ncbi:MAG: hypothetical protein ABIR92_03945 [Gemmatimonadaceae bacterium]
MKLLVRVALTVVLADAPVGAQSTIPSQLSDKEFWQLVTDVSEPGGFFRSDNFLSNEMGFLYPIAELKRTTRQGGVYLGVGPEQNFTYIAALQPKMAVLFDIRRQMMVHHLMYKALFELSADRGEFLSKLFSRPRPAGIDSMTNPIALFGLFIDAEPDSAMYRRNRIAIKDHLTKTHGFAITGEDSASLDYVYGAFYEAGPLISYSFRPGSGTARFNGERITLRSASGDVIGATTVNFMRGGMANYAELQSTTDAAGSALAFLASEQTYRSVKGMHQRNMIVPVVGNFAGPKAIRAIGQYLRDHNATVTAFYLSNVEQYLFQQGDDWKKWFDNVAALPLDSTSTFIRSGRGGTSSGVIGLASMLASMQGQVKLFLDGKILTYFDVINTSR